MTHPPGGPVDPADPGAGQQPYPYPEYSGYPTGYPPGYPGAHPNGYPVAYPPPPRARDTNIWAILALISALTVPPLAIVAGHVALSQIKRTGDQGRGLAIAGLVIGYVFTVIFVLAVIAGVWIELTEDDLRDYNRDYGTYSMSVTSDRADSHGHGPLPLSSV